MADLYDLSSRRLLRIASSPREDWVALMNQAVEEKAAQMADPQWREELASSQRLDLEGGSEELNPGKPDKETRFYTADRRAQPAVKALTGLRRYYNTFVRTEPKQREALMDAVVDELALSDQQGWDLLVSLEELTSLLRLRLKGKKDS